MRVLNAAALGTLLLVTAAMASPPVYNAVNAEHFYYSGGTAQPLVLDTQRIAVRFKAPAGPDAIMMSNPELRLVEESGVGEEFRLEVFELPAPGSAVVSATVAELNSRTDVEFASPVFYAGGREAILTDELWVRFRDDLSDGQVADLVAAYGVEIVKRTGSRPNSYVLRVTSESPGDALTVSHAYYENENVISAHPNFVVSLQLDLVPDDTYYSDSWNLDNTEQRGGTADADIDMPEGWDLATGSTSIVVAVMDGHGVQTGHPDFSGKTVTGYDAYDGDNDPSPGVSCEGHGTCCAGIACAATNNSLGVSGVGWNVKLMGVRIGSDPDCDGSFSTTYAIIEDAFVTVTDRGAHVLSNSWSMGNLDVDQVHDGIIYAKTNGRGGLGCVVCFSTANGDNPTIAYPSRYVECVAVGATNWCDERKRAVDDDCNNHEYWWGSNYGPGIDVVAPGIATWTTDNPGAGGYNTGSTADGDAAGNYFKWFGGTSGACPHVAGLAALVISVNGSLTASQVQTYIQNGADDMVGLVGEDTAGWDQYMGHGRINVFNTLMLVDQPNLTPYLLSGWDDKIVPRNTNDATGGSCPLPDSLFGNVTSTWLNWSEINSSSVGCPPHGDRGYLDDIYVFWGSWGRFGPNQAGAALNVGTLYVRGGLHTLSVLLDWDDQVVEKNEADNAYAQQFAWTPYILADRTPVYRGVPPNKGVLAYPNSDGFQADYVWMTAVAMTPANVADDYDLRLHPAYSSPTTSFRSYYDNSSAGAGYTDLIIANYFGGANRTEDMGVFRYNTSGPGAGMYVEKSDLIYAFSYEGTYGPYTMSAYRLVDLYAPYFTTAGDYTFEVEITSGTADLVLAIYNYSTDYFDRFEYLDYSDAGGDGEGEEVNAPLVASQYYPLAVFKDGTGDIAKEVTYLIHVCKTPPNLQPYTPAAWDYPVVPRDKTCTLGDVTLTDSLAGDSTGTYLNFSWWNAGPDTAGGHSTYILRDGSAFVAGTVSHINPGYYVYAANWGPYYFDSGRHTLTESVDHLDEVLETNEGDNVWEMQFAWTPVVLTDDVPIVRSSPPNPGAYAYPNCDGYQLAGGWWNAVGMIPVDASDDYDVHMHMPYPGSLDGFGVAYELSFSPAGFSDLVIFNGNHASIGYAATRDASVFIDNVSAGGDYYVEGDGTSVTYPAPTTISSQSLDANEILDIFEVRFDEIGNWTVELIPVGGDANVGISMYDYLGSYMDKSETMPGAYANSNGAGEPEMFTVQIDTTGYYGLVVWKSNSWDLPETMAYDLKIYRTPSNLTYSTPAGWSYPLTPRSTGDATQYYAPISASLPGNTNSTYVNVSWCNEGPDTVGPHETHCYLDGSVIAGLRRVAPLGPEDTLFVRNLGPYTARGGRHTLSVDIDVLDEVLESNESDNFWSRQYVWSPLELVVGMPVTRIEPPDPGMGAIPNSDGYYFPKPLTYTNVIGMCPQGNHDYDLYLYDDYSGSESGFGVLLAASLMGTGQTEFVGVRYNYIDTGQYPAAVKSLPAKGSGESEGGEPLDAALQTGLVVHAVTSQGQVIYDSDLPVERAGALGSNEILGVYDVDLDALTYDFHLVNDGGNADLAFAIMPIGSDFYGRGDAAFEVNYGGPGDDEFRTLTVGTPGWFELVVFKTGYAELGKTSNFRLRISEHGTAGVWQQEPGIPSDLVIEQNRPNPFGEFTTVVYGVPDAGVRVKLRVYDTSGRLVATLVDEFKQPGYHNATWDGMTNAGNAAASGVYFCRLDAGERTLTRQMLLLK